KYLTDDYYSEEIEKELGTINTQLAYLYQLQGRITEVIDLYQSAILTLLFFEKLLLKNEFRTDITVSAIASNNFVTAKKDTELFDSAHKLKVASTNTLDYKLFRSQRRIIAMNEALLSLYIHKHTAFQDVTRRLLQTYPENDDLHLILASISYRQKNITKVIQELQEFLKLKPDSLYINFAIMQPQLLQSNLTSALEKFLSLIKDDAEKYKPWVREKVSDHYAEHSLDHAEVYNID
ncbi:4065_t:CDS:2, partial [Scutellospora calospora]